MRLDVVLERVEQVGVLTLDGITARDTIRYHKVLTMPAAKLPAFVDAVTAVEQLGEPAAAEGGSSELRQSRRRPAGVPKRSGRRRGRGRGRRPRAASGERHGVDETGADA